MIYLLGECKFPKNESIEERGVFFNLESDFDFRLHRSPTI